MASGGNRIDQYIIAKYEFKTGSGDTIYDTSGKGAELNLTMSGNIEWVGGWGVNIKAGGKAQGTVTASAKLSDRHQGHRRIFHRGLGRAGQRDAGRRLHRQLLRQRDHAQRDAGAARLPVRGAGAFHHARVRTARRRC